MPVGGASEDGDTVSVSADKGAADETADTAADSGKTAENAAPQAPAPMTMDEVFATIERLATLRDKGAITQEDFDAKKAELLARI